MKRSGMSLLEILIVLSILAVLIAIVAPRILGSQKKADIKSTRLQIANVEEALKLYAADNRTFPSTEEGLLALMVKPDDEKRARSWDGPYFDGEETPSDPWGNEFRYEYPPTKNKRDFPDIWSLGPDGVENTEDDIGNFTTDSERGSDSDIRSDR
ncbi:MAG: type II secretion system major pseudopilin GspG [Pirellulaceae bacterium]|jgi:general secretion pathway protein G|nr:type II secretion system major pseudopilin GspG [Pirellulaceae bacterium]